MVGKLEAGPAQAPPRPGDDPPAAPPTGYTIVLPPGWRRIPVRQGSDEAIRGIVDEVFRKLPRELPRDRVAPYRMELEGRLRAMVARASRNAAIDLYLPIEMMHGSPVAASFVVSEFSLNSVETLDPELIVAKLASADGETRPVTVHGALAARSESVAGPDAPNEIDGASRRVDYAVSVPADPDRWLAISFSTLGGGDPDDGFAKVLVELFDAMMSTFRWTGPGPGPEPGHAEPRSR